MLQEGEESSGRTSSTQSSFFLYMIRKKKLRVQARERKDPITPTLRGCVITELPSKKNSSLYLLTVSSSRAIILFPILGKEENNPSSPGSPNVVLPEVISLRETHKLPKELPTTPELPFRRHLLSFNGIAYQFFFFFFFGLKTKIQVLDTKFFFYFTSTGSSGCPKVSTFIRRRCAAPASHRTFQTFLIIITGVKV